MQHPSLETHHNLKQKVIQKSPIIIQSTCTVSITSFPNDQFLDWSKLKALADDKLNVTEKLKIVWAG